MDLNPYIESLRRELALAAQAGGEDARGLAERLTAPLEASTRLALLEALSAAADEITRDLAPGSVEVRLRGREPQFVVTPPPIDEPAPAPASLPPAPDGEEGAVARVNLRLPEHLKSRVDQAAARKGMSVNAWLVRAAAAALDGESRGHSQPQAPRGGQRYVGWVR